MNLPQVPTDNLYKFWSISCLATALVLLWSTNEAFEKWATERATVHAEVEAVGQNQDAIAEHIRTIYATPPQNEAQLELLKAEQQWIAEGIRKDRERLAEMARKRSSRVSMAVMPHQTPAVKVTEEHDSFIATAVKSSGAGRLTSVARAQVVAATIAALEFAGHDQHQPTFTGPDWLKAELAQRGHTL